MNNNFQILTPSGFKDFDGIVKNNKKCIRIEFESGNSIECSTDHPFFNDGIMIRANQLKVEDLIDRQKHKRENYFNQKYWYKKMLRYS